MEPEPFGLGSIVVSRRTTGAPIMKERSIRIVLCYKTACMLSF